MCVEQPIRVEDYTPEERQRRERFINMSREDCFHNQGELARKKEWSPENDWTFQEYKKLAREAGL